MSKQVWGNNTWNLFHTISVKIKQEASFDDIQNVLVIIREICNNLPCPICSNHAIQLFKSVKLNSIRNKEDLIHFLFVFHNKVNTRLKKNIFLKELLLPTYEKQNLNNCLNMFVHIYNNIRGSNHMMMYNFHRKQIVQKVIEYFKKNLTLYNFN